MGVVVAFLIAQASVLVNSVYLHRALAHQSIRFSPKAEAVLRYVAPLVVGVRLRRWCGVHRLHHAHPDEATLDPHSPRFHGRVTVLLATPLLYTAYLRHHGREVDAAAADIPDGPVDAVVGNLAVRFVVLTGLLLPNFGPRAFFVVVTEFVLRTVILGALNCLHREDDAFRARICDSPTLVLIGWGEGYHRKHHERPGDYCFRDGRLPDPGAVVVRMCLALGLASRQPLHRGGLLLVGNSNESTTTVPGRPATPGAAA